MKRRLLINWAQKILACILLISYFIATKAVLSARILPDKYLFIILPLSFLLIAIIIYLTLKQKLSPIKKILLTIVALGLIAANICSYTFCTSTKSFLTNIQTTNYSLQNYKVVALKSQAIKLDKRSNQKVGLLKNDLQNNLVAAELSKKSPATYFYYDNITSLTAGLDDQKIAIAAINDSQLQLLKDNYSSFYQKLELLANLQVKTKNTPSTITNIAQPFAIYISGIDTYGQIAAVSRSDVNILAIVNPQNHKILLVNTPRDYYVQLHNTTGPKDKLTHAGIYGIDMSVKTLEDLYNTPIDQYIRINFSSLTNLVDVIGGINVYSKYNFSADNTNFVEGYNQLNGRQALAFSRERYAFENGDRTRGENQQLAIEAIIAKINNPKTILTYQQILGALQGSFQTSMSQDNITSLIKDQLDDLGNWQIESISATGTDSRNYTYSMGNIMLYVMEPNETSLEAARQKIQQYRL